MLCMGSTNLTADAAARFANSSDTSQPRYELASAATDLSPSGILFFLCSRLVMTSDFLF
jgi:hypothetical protein